MPKLVREVERSLLKKGFRKEEGDHTFYFLYIDGKKTRVKTKISHGEREIGAPLEKAMRKQMHLEKKEFDEYVACTLSEAMYIALLRNKGIVE